MKEQINYNKIDEMTLALMHLTTFENARTWKGYDWVAMDRLYKKNYISDPKTKNKSVLITPEAQEISKRLFNQHFMQTK